MHIFLVLLGVYLMLALFLTVVKGLIAKTTPTNIFEEVLSVVSSLNGKYKAFYDCLSGDYAKEATKE